MTKQLFKQWFFALMILLILFPLGTAAAQETPASGAANSSGASLSWSLRNAEGDIILTRDGRRTALQGDSSRAQGVLLGARDMVQTGKGSAELQLQSAGNPAVVSLALSENTSVVLDQLSGGIVLELLYGRLAVKSGEEITVRAGNSAALFGECDAVIEYAARPGIAQPMLLIRCLEGEGELTAQAAAETGGTKFAIRSAELLSLEYRVPFVYVERSSLAPASVSPLSFPVEPRREAVSAGKSRSHRIRTGNTIVGFLLVGAGAAMQGYAYFAQQGYRVVFNPSAEQANSIFYAGYAPLALGAAFLLGAAFDANVHGAD